MKHTTAANQKNNKSNVFKEYDFNINYQVTFDLF